MVYGSFHRKWCVRNTLFFFFYFAYKKNIENVIKWTENME